MAATPAPPNEIPARCPVCSTEIPPGRNRCHGCGKVFGEDNRCPHCLAVAPVLRTGQGAICSACSKPRE
jgi:predicted amidophosphoribosyltransferase